MSGTITSGKCCLQLSFTNIHLTFGSVASETESPAGISAPAAAIFGCHFCPRSPSVCFCLLSRFLLLFFYICETCERKSPACNICGFESCVICQVGYFVIHTAILTQQIGFSLFTGNVCGQQNNI